MSAHAPAKFPADSDASPEPRAALFGSLPVVAIGLCVFVAVVVLASRGKFIHMMEEFEVELPLWTECVLDLRFSLVLACVTGITIAKELFVGNDKVRNAMNYAALLIGLACFAGYLMGVSIPLLKMIEALS